MSQIHKILKKHWGYDNFRPLQEDIINSVLSGKDTLALLPTGGGKSICFQVPALALDGICIVISPLIALMKDQVVNLKKAGINAISITSGMRKTEIDYALDNCVYGDVKFLYISPERLKTELFVERLKRMKVGLLAIDEAHCISQWGYDFRPPYLQIAEIRQYIPNVPCIALTASATQEVCEDIQEKLEFKEKNIFRKSFARKNLSYSTFYCEDKHARVLEILNKVPGTAVVYVRSRNKTQQIAQFLSKNGINADFYHAGLEPNIRSKKQEDWINDKTRVIVSTNAFGMGIDKPNVRVVVHLDIPPDLESYYQEAGRAGRDEKLAYAVLLFDNTDIDSLKENIEIQHPSFKEIQRVYQALANYFRLALGSGENESFPIDLNEFSKRYDMNKMISYYAIKKIENQGLLSLNDAFSTKSKVLFKVTNSDLYTFQLNNKPYDHFIQMLLRMYGGELFTHFISIDERDLAKELKTTDIKIREALRKLQQMELLLYDELSDLPQIVFLKPREDAKYLSVNKRILDNQKALAEKKVSAIVNYAENKLRCRTQMILEYFDEITDDTCGNCDFCINERKKLKKTTIFKDIKTELLDLLAKKPHTLDELKHRLAHYKTPDISNTIRELLDVETIYFFEDYLKLK